MALPGIRIFAGGASNICINYNTLAMGYLYVVLHPVNDLSSITVKNINFTSQQDYYCFHVGGEDIFSIAVFEWTSNDFFSYQPTTVVKVPTFIVTSTIAEVPTRNEPGELLTTVIDYNSL